MGKVVQGTLPRFIRSHITNINFIGFAEATAKSLFLCDDSPSGHRLGILARLVSFKFDWSGAWLLAERDQL
jgi:hypothetical protein